MFKELCFKAPFEALVAQGKWQIPFKEETNSRDLGGRFKCVVGHWVRIRSKSTWLGQQIDFHVFFFLILSRVCMFLGYALKRFLKQLSLELSTPACVTFITNAFSASRSVWRTNYI